MDSQTVTVCTVLTWATDRFRKAGIESSRLDAEILLSAVLEVNRIRLYTHQDQPLTEGERSAFSGLVERRASLEPVAYLLGRKEFYGRDFLVGPAVLVPRPETEHLVEAALGWTQAGGGAPRVADIGCGSGAVGVTLCRIRRVKGASTHPLVPLRSFPRLRMWMSISMTTNCVSMCIAPVVPEGNRLTRPTLLCGSPIFPPAWWCAARTKKVSTKTRLRV